MDRFATYIRATAAEMKHVSWPTQKQALVLTVAVIVVSILVALFTGAFDYLFTGMLDAVL